MHWARRALGKCGGVALAVVQYGCIAHCTFEFLGDFVFCSGPSMKPTITERDIILTERISVKRRDVKVGDIVVSRSPTDPRQFICKRVKAIEGDTVSYRGLGRDIAYVPRGHVWLEGDNSENSTDSRNYGPVPLGLIRSRVYFKIWPLYNMQSLTHTSRKEKE